MNLNENQYATKTSLISSDCKNHVTQLCLVNKTQHSKTIENFFFRMSFCCNFASIIIIAYNIITNKDKIYL